MNGLLRHCRRAPAYFMLVLVLDLLSPAPSACADTIYDISIDTTSLVGLGSIVAFDFVAGGGTQTNGISISDFASNGTLIPASTSGAVNSGSVSGALPNTVSLTNASFFNEYQQGMTLGSTLSFQLDATTNAPTAGSLPDTFSLFLLDPTATTSLPTTDPTGANSLFTLQIDGSANGILSLYSSSVPSAPVTVTAAPVPLPAGLPLLLSGLWGLSLWGIRKSTR